MLDPKQEALFKEQARRERQHQIEKEKEIAQSKARETFGNKPFFEENRDNYRLVLKSGYLLQFISITCGIPALFLALYNQFGFLILSAFLCGIILLLIEAFKRSTFPKFTNKIAAKKPFDFPLALFCSALIVVSFYLSASGSFKVKELLFGKEQLRPVNKEAIKAEIKKDFSENITFAEARVDSARERAEKFEASNKYKGTIVRNSQGTNNQLKENLIIAEKEVSAIRKDQSQAIQEAILAEELREKERFRLVQAENNESSYLLFYINIASELLFLLSMFYKSNFDYKLFLEARAQEQKEQQKKQYQEEKFVENTTKTTETKRKERKEPQKEGELAEGQILDNSNGLRIVAKVGKNLKPFKRHQLTGRLSSARIAAEKAVKDNKTPNLERINYFEGLISELDKYKNYGRNI